MITKIYTMRDRKSGVYGNPFLSHNDDTAKRDFDAFCGLEQNKYISGDMELYSLGTFDSETGCIEDYAPVFVKGGVVYE